MQFYQLHIDPKLSSELLPDYALKSVNIREGYQILSDCGYALNILWEEQNKEYNRYHPNTWRYWKTKKAFISFLRHYKENLIEYKKRFGKTKTYNTYFNKFYSFLKEISRSDLLIIDRTEEQHMALYMLNRKIKYLSEEEITRLEELCYIYKIS